MIAKMNHGDYLLETTNNSLVMEELMAFMLADGAMCFIDVIKVLNMNFCAQK